MREARTSSDEFEKNVAKIMYMLGRFHIDPDKSDGKRLYYTMLGLFQQEPKLNTETAFVTACEHYIKGGERQGVISTTKETSATDLTGIPFKRPLEVASPYKQVTTTVFDPQRDRDLPPFTMCIVSGRSNSNIDITYWHIVVDKTPRVEGTFSRKITDDVCIVDKVETITLVGNPLLDLGADWKVIWPTSSV